VKPVILLRNPDSPIVVSVPHGSGFIPRGIKRQLGITLAEGPLDLGTRELACEAAAAFATLVLAGFSRIVIDVNRYPEPSALDVAPSANPEEGRKRDSDRLVRHFAGNRRLWRHPPDQKELRRRVRAYHLPFHRALGRELARIRKRKGAVLLVDLHSMSDDAFDFILGDNGGTSAGKSVCLLIRRLLAEASGLDPSRIGYAGSEVWDPGRRGDLSPALLGRTGGFITVNYGRPREGIFAVQLEVSRLLFSRANTRRIREQALKQLISPMREFFGRMAALPETGAWPPGPIRTRPSARKGSASTGRAA